MKAKDLGKLAHEQFKAGDRAAFKETVKQMNAATTRKAEARRTGKLGLGR